MHMDACNDIIGLSWAKRTTSILDHLGFTDIRTSFDINVNYLPLLKCRVRDQFIQEWNASINNSSKLYYYAKFKNVFGYEDYLDKLTNITLRKYLTRFRVSSHNLEIEVGRYHGIDRENRTCKLCNVNVIESEFHFLLCCSKYTEIRNIYVGALSWPSINMFNNMLSTKNKKNLNNLSKFLKEAFECRKNTLET